MSESLRIMPTEQPGLLVVSHWENSLLILVMVESGKDWAAVLCVSAMLIKRTATKIVVLKFIDVYWRNNWLFLP